MKKLFLNLSITIFLVTFTLMIYSCTNKSEICETCQVAESTPSNLNLFGENFKVSAFENKNEKFTIFMGLIPKSKGLAKFYLDLGTKDKLINKYEIAATVFYSEKSIDKKSGGLDLCSNEIQGFVTYIKQNESFYVAKIFKNINNEFKEIKTSGYKTNIISTNDFYSISRLINHKISNSVILLMDNSKTIKNTGSFNDLTEKINTELTAQRLPIGDKNCGYPCQYGDSRSQHCVPQSYLGQLYGECESDATCPEEDIQKSLISNNITNFNYSEIGNDLRYFRDNYLGKTAGGSKIINEYYELGGKIPLENLSLEQKINTFNIIVSDILPAIYSLIDNPNDSQILINNNSSNKIIVYLGEIKTITTDIETKNRIQHLIDMVNHFSNKSNKYITENLNDF